jgi:uncharacterized protein
MQMDALIQLLTKTLFQVWTSFTHNWPFLIVSILIAVLLKLYTDPNKVGAFLLRHRRAGVIGATAAAVGTPLCSCGTTAVILGMMASTLPWAPIIAFMVASPLTSPEELFYSAGLFGWPFALSFFISSILLGLFAGLAASILENRGWFKNQSRYSTNRPVLPRRVQARQELGNACGCSPVIAQSSISAANVLPASRKYTLDLGMNAAMRPAAVFEPACACTSGLQADAPWVDACGCNASAGERAISQTQTQSNFLVFVHEVYATGKRLIPMFIGFAFIGYFLNNLIPAAWVSAIFGSGNVYSVPLAATLGLPLYINTEASLPLVRALIDGGMSQGAALAFLITGAGTSIGAITGALTIARWRVIALVLGVLWSGAIVLGWAYNLLLSTGLL